MPKPSEVWNKLFPPEIGDKVQLSWRNGMEFTTVRGKLLAIPTGRGKRIGGVVPTYIIHGEFISKKLSKIERTEDIMVEVVNATDPKVKVKVLERHRN